MDTGRRKTHAADPKKHYPQTRRLGNLLYDTGQTLWSPRALVRRGEIISQKATGGIRMHRPSQGSVLVCRRASYQRTEQLTIKQKTEPERIRTQ